jgi:hypothetical protein
MKIRLNLVALAALWTFSGTAAAVGSIADVMIYDRAEGRSLPVYRHEGRYYVAGKPGAEYEIRVRNTTGADILAVVSVDGVNAVSGETASWDQTGYVLGPYQSYDIKGWRKSLQRVAAFFFTEHQNAYAARTGRPDNVGVIGIAVFRRKAEPRAQILRERRPDARGEAPAERSAAEAAETAASPAAAPRKDEAAAPAGGLRFAEKSASLGTGHGRSQASHVSHTDFERATAVPEEVVAVHYDSYRNLVAQGVIRGPRIATPFPGQFVPDPR